MSQLRAISLPMQPSRAKMKYLWLVFISVVVMAMNVSAVCDTQSNCDISCSSLFSLYYNNTWNQLDNSPFGNICKPVGFENPLIMTQEACSDTLGIDMNGDCVENTNGTEDVICPSYRNTNTSVVSADCFVFDFDTSGYIPVVGNETTLTTFSFADPFFAGNGGGPGSSSTWSQIYWYTAENVAHSIQYGIYNTSIGCAQTAMFFIEPPPIDGRAKKLNASTDQTGYYKCQNDTQGVFKISNDGTVGINITMMFNRITNGVRPKMGYSTGGWKSSCTGFCNSSSCDLSSDCMQLNITSQQVIYNLPQNSSKEIWLWADFNGVSGAQGVTKGNLTTTAIKSL